MMHSQHIRLLQDVARNYERESKNSQSDAFSIIVKSVAIGSLVYLANSVIRSHLNEQFRTGASRSR